MERKIFQIVTGLAAVATALVLAGPALGWLPLTVTPHCVNGEVSWTVSASQAEQDRLVEVDNDGDFAPYLDLIELDQQTLTREYEGGYTTLYARWHSDHSIVTKGVFEGSCTTTEPTPTPNPTPTPTPEATPTPTPDPTPTNTPSASPTPTPSTSPSTTPSSTPTVTDTPPGTLPPTDTGPTEVRQSAAVDLGNVLLIVWGVILVAWIILILRPVRKSR